ncbi:MAG: hypothetical protein ACJ74Z_21830 [Bryobacteraceae bacterium]
MPVIPLMARCDIPADAIGNRTGQNALRAREHQRQRDEGTDHSNAYAHLGSS